MENFLEFLAPISMLITAAMLFVVNFMEIKKEKEEEKLRAFKEQHNEIKRRWKEADEREI